MHSVKRLLWQFAHALVSPGPLPSPRLCPPMPACSCSSICGQSCVSPVPDWVQRPALLPCPSAAVCTSQSQTQVSPQTASLPCLHNGTPIVSVGKLLSHTADHLFFILMMTVNQSRKNVAKIWASLGPILLPGSGGHAGDQWLILIPTNVGRLIEALYMGWGISECPAFPDSDLCSAWGPLPHLCS